MSGTAVRPRVHGQGDELSAMLLSVEEIRGIVGADNIEITETYEKFLDYVEFTPEECAGVPFNTIERAYRNSGYQAVSGMIMQNDGQQRWIDEGVVRFATAAAARRFVSDSERIWQDCSGVRAHAVPDEDTAGQIWAIRDTVRLRNFNGLMVTSSRVDRPGRECAHAMADRAQLVIDVAVCGPQIDDEAVTILAGIADRPPI
ncbi:sensor domain-containing protein [Mycobacterium deserti]|uniref:Sensor domain-containing protein n=1 Tax=Mycobacterium deserti TaxID=2978347 RepID=A0ABT2MJY8_9MYCO|nr:sensor domain-containing protein [Mycobacterium deserti]MCT7661735.1 sensor domain-containing protein [Mycobacterium deserti]